jgi:hypothetical protein
MLTANGTAKPQLRPVAGVCRWVWPLGQGFHGLVELA